MAKIIRFHETSGADVLKIEDLPLTEPGEGGVRGPLANSDRPSSEHC